MWSPDYLSTQKRPVGGRTSKWTIARSSATTDWIAGETTVKPRTRLNHRVVTDDTIPAAAVDVDPLSLPGARPQNAHRVDDLVRNRIGTLDDAPVPGWNAAVPDLAHTGRTDAAAIDAADLDNG